MISITFGPTTLTSQGSWDVYVLKLDTDGNWQWAVRGGSSSTDGNWDIVTDGDGTSYTAGVFDGTATYGATTITTQGGRDIFVTKIDTNGNWLWAISAGGTSSYEFSYFGIPNIIISIADNQLAISDEFDKQNISIYLGRKEQFSSENLKNKVKELIEDSQLRRKLSENGKKLVDGVLTNWLSRLSTGSVFSFVERI